MNISILAKDTNFISKRDFNVVEADKGYFSKFQEKFGFVEPNIMRQCSMVELLQSCIGTIMWHSNLHLSTA